MIIKSGNHFSVCIQLDYFIQLSASKSFMWNIDNFENQWNIVKQAIGYGISTCSGLAVYIIYAYIRKPSINI